MPRPSLSLPFPDSWSQTHNRTLLVTQQLLTWCKRPERLLDLLKLSMILGNKYVTYENSHFRRKKNLCPFSQLFPMIHHSFVYWVLLCCFFHQVLVELTAIMDRMVLSQKPKPCILKGVLSDDHRLLIDGLNYNAIETHFLGC